MARIPDPTAKISLLRAAEDVFAEKGLAAAKVQDITQRAGLSKGAFYLHFQSKEEAFLQVVESFLARCWAMCNTPPLNDPAVPTDPDGMLAHWLEKDVQMLEFLWQNRGIVRILPACQGPHTYLLETFRDAMDKNCVAWIEAWKKAQLVREELDTMVVAAMVQGAWHELVHRMLNLSQKPMLQEWLRHVQSILVRGVGSPSLVSALNARAVGGAPVQPRSTPRLLINRPVIHAERRRRVRIS